MLAASWILSTHNIVKDNKKKKQVAASGFLLIAPWISIQFLGEWALLRKHTLNGYPVLLNNRCGIPFLYQAAYY